MSSKVSELLQARVDQLAQSIAGLPADSQQSLAPALAGLGQLSELAGQQELLLETAAAISDAAGSVTNVDELLDISANIIQNHFGFAQVLIFLNTRTEQWAECRAAAGNDSPAGQKNQNRWRVAGWPGHSPAGTAAGRRRCRHHRSRLSTAQPGPNCGRYFGKAIGPAAHPPICAAFSK